MILYSEKGKGSGNTYKRIDSRAFSAPLSKEAFRVLFYVLGQNESWVILASDIAEQLGFGKKKAGKLLTEICNAGFALRKPYVVRGKKGFNGQCYVFADYPAFIDPTIIDPSIIDRSMERQSELQCIRTTMNRKRQSSSNKRTTTEGPSKETSKAAQEQEDQEDDKETKSSLEHTFPADLEAGRRGPLSVDRPDSPRGINFDPILCQIPLEPFHIHYLQAHHERYPLTLTKGIPRLLDAVAVFSIKNEWEMTDYEKHLHLWGPVHDSSGYNKRQIEKGESLDYSPHILFTALKSAMIQAIRAEKAAKKQAIKDAEDEAREKKQAEEWAVQKPLLRAELIADQLKDKYFRKDGNFVEWVAEFIIYENLPEETVKALVVERDRRLESLRA